MRKLYVLLLLLFTISMLVACGGNASNEEKEKDSEAGKEESEVKDSSWEDVQESGEIVVGTSGTLIAASYYAGEEENENELTGFDVEVMREIADRLDLDIKFEIMGVDGMLPGIKSGRIDVAANDIEVTDNRKEEFNFSEAYKYSYTTMAVREADNSGIESLEDLEGKRAGGGATTIYSQIAEQFGAEVVTYGNAPNEAYLRDVNDATTDVVINDYYLTKFGVGAFPDFEIHLHPTLKFYPTTTAVILSKDADTLTEKIDEALAEMREDGSLSALAIQFYEEDASVEPEGDIVEVDGLDL